MSTQRYYTGIQPAESTRLKLLYLSKSKYEKDWHSTLHSHRCAELFYVESGRGRFRVEEKAFWVQAGDMVMVNPYVEHTEEGVAETPMEYIVLGVEGVSYASTAAKDDARYHHICGGDDKCIYTYLELVAGELEKRGEHYEAITANLLENLLMLLLRQPYSAVALPPAKKSSKECMLVKQYINNHYAENLTLDMLAEVAHINKYYLSHIFKKENGISPNNYLIGRRIEESRYYLENTDYSISQIAQLLGFSSASYFSQSFRRLEKASPREYRRRKLDAPAQND